MSDRSVEVVLQFYTILVLSVVFSWSAYQELEFVAIIKALSESMNERQQGFRMFPEALQ